jgi:CRISPR type IV-associated protein Csf3
MNHYEPLRVVAELRSQVMVERWPMLDAVMAATVIDDGQSRERARQARRYYFYLKNCRKHGRQETDDWYRKSEKYGYIPEPVWNGHFLPLGVFGHGLEHGVWTYRCSTATPVGDYELDTVHFTKRIDWLGAVDYVQAADRKINIGKGAFVSQYIPYQTVAVEALEWHIFGVAEEVGAILDAALSIGKKRRRGYGVIKRWHIEQAADDESVFTRDGYLARPVPVDLLDEMHITGDFEKEFCGFRPPYWQYKNIRTCAVRGRRQDHALDEARSQTGRQPV